MATVQRGSWKVSDYFWLLVTKLSPVVAALCPRCTELPSPLRSAQLFFSSKASKLSLSNVNNLKFNSLNFYNLKFGFWICEHIKLKVKTGHSKIRGIKLRGKKKSCFFSVKNSICLKIKNQMNQMFLHTLFYVHSLACSCESGWMHHYIMYFISSCLVPSSCYHCSLQHWEQQMLVTPVKWFQILVVDNTRKPFSVALCSRRNNKGEGRGGTKQLIIWDRCMPRYVAVNIKWSFMRLSKCTI